MFISLTDASSQKRIMVKISSIELIAEKDGYTEVWAGSSNPHTVKETYEVIGVKLLSSKVIV